MNKIEKVKGRWTIQMFSDLCLDWVVVDEFNTKEEAEQKLREIEGD